MNVIEIVRKHLNDNGYDGLFHPGECACKKDDLAPCGEILGVCEAGYLKPGGAEHDWHIGAKNRDPDHLLAQMHDTNTNHQRRALIGDRLAEIGDPRPGVGLRSDGLPDLLWANIPAGKITLEDEAAGTFKVEPFYMARYPVTYQQFKAFYDSADGFKDKSWWQGLAVRQSWKNYDSADNIPVHTVTWYDAIAYCRWLSQQLGYEIALPTEWQWQHAATAGHPNNTYPWGSDWQDGYANTKESGLNRPIAVGLYPQGQVRFGEQANQVLDDMAGNVWEWCLNKSGSPKDIALDGNDTRVVRGGSWVGDSAPARAAFRYRDPPDSRWYDLGFRVCCVSPVVDGVVLRFEVRDVRLLLG